MKTGCYVIETLVGDSQSRVNERFYAASLADAKAIIKGFGADPMKQHWRIMRCLEQSNDRDRWE